MNVLFLKRFFPVIHCVDPFYRQGVDHAILNTKIAMENFADGVFLIGHKIDKYDLYSIYEQVRKEFPNIWIGINFLDVSNFITLEVMINKCQGLDGIWINTLPHKRLGIPSSVAVFGDVAFKYSDLDIHSEELKMSCCRAKQLVDVITTSGTKTGDDPDTAKIKEIRKNIGNTTRLAVAGHITLENISLFLPTVSDFVVDSNVIENRKGCGHRDYFIPEKVFAMSTMIHS